MDIDGILPQDADYIMAENSEFMTGDSSWKRGGTGC